MKTFQCFVLALTINVVTVSAQSTHPKLLFGSSDLNTIWNNIVTNSTYLQTYYNDLRDNANFNKTTAFYNDHYKMHYASDMAFVYLIEPTYTFRMDFFNYSKNSLPNMYSIAISNPTNTQISTSALMHISLAYDMLFNDLTNSERYQAATNIKTLMDELLDNYFNPPPNGPQQQTLYGNNHLMHIAAAVGIGAITIRGDYLNSSTIFTAANAAPYIDKASYWLDLLDKNMFASDGACFEGAHYGLWGFQPIIAYYESLRRNGGTDYFPTSNLRRIYEWVTMELIPARPAYTTINGNLFDINNINASFHFTGGGDSSADPTRQCLIFSALGGIYQADANAGAATWLFENTWGVLKTYNSAQPNPVSNHQFRMYNRFGSTNILALRYYANNAQHPDLLAMMPKSKFFLGRGLIARDGYANEGTLFSFETNFNYNEETGKTCWRWDENDNNSFTFFAYGKRWIIDSGKKLSGIQEEQGDYHSTVIVDGQNPPYLDDTRQQVANWYDYHNVNGVYYITSDITDSWTKRVFPDVNPTTDFSGTGLVETCVTPCPFPSFQKARRHTQYIPKEGDLPPYVIIYDDIQQSTTTPRNYRFLLQTGSGNTVSSLSGNKVTITSAVYSPNRIMEVYYYSIAASNSFATPSETTDTDGAHRRLEYTANNTLNPHFHAVLVPSQNTNSALVPSGLSFTNLSNQGSVATIDFASTTTPRKDFSLFAYQKSLSSGGFALEGFDAPSYNGVSGVMGYCRKIKTTGEVIDIFLDRGSYLKMDNTDLVLIAGRTARVVLNDNEINVYKVSGSGRYSYKVFGKNVPQFKIYGTPQTFQAFNSYNYIKSTSVILNYSATLAGPKSATISWYCSEAHDIDVYYWTYANLVSKQSFPGRSAGNNSVTISLPGIASSFTYRLEGRMTSDSFRDLTDSFIIVVGPKVIAENESTTQFKDFLYKNSPNPFNPTTTIIYSLATTTNVSITIYNSLGKKIMTLFSGVQNAGQHQLIFDASEFSSGLYFCVMETPEFKDSIELMLIK